jgi:hypothetical protein
VAVPVFVPGSFSTPRVASLLILAAGAGSLVNGFSVRFGLAGGLGSATLFLLLFIAAAGWMPEGGLPAIVGWLLGLPLFCLGFFRIRHALRSSDSYQARKDTIFS